MEYFISNLSRDNWDYIGEKNHCSLKGRLFLGGVPTEIVQFSQKLIDAKRSGGLLPFLQKLNGFYSWVHENGDSVIAGVDHVRSWPIFYAIGGKLLFLSDDADWVRQQVGDTEMDPLAREEFLLSGYVTGSDTLYPKVKQLQAGECLEAVFQNGEWYLKTQRFFRFWHTEPEIFNEEDLREELEEVTLSVMQRLIEYADGRQIVIPLSGGYDSRLIATMLHRLNYTNVLCFTYGVRGNREAEYSRLVAEALGFQWYFVEYSADFWRSAWRTQDAEIFRKHSSNNTSLPHVQDWLAIKVLIENKIILSDSITVPGHSGDFVAGSHIPDFVFEKGGHCENELLSVLAKDHLSNVPKLGMTLAADGFLENRLRDRINSPFDGSAIGMANLYELWDWQERQCKYIINSVRAYDQFNLQWWLPLWDLEFINFWQKVPLSLRKERKWFKDWIAKQYDSQIGGLIKPGNLKNAADHSLIILMLKTIAETLPRPLFYAIKKRWEQKKICSHILALDGLVPPSEISKYLQKQYNIVGIYSHLYISGMW